MDLLAETCQTGDQCANLALEEALARAGPPRSLLRLWQNATCVVLGRAQQPQREVNLAACAAARVPVLRRGSGGGTVYQDLGNLNITLAVPGFAPGLATELAALIVGVLERLGVPGPGLTVAAAPRGVLAGRAKVSGLASQLTRAGSVAHATLLVTTPAGQISAFLTPAPAGRRPADSHRSPVAALCDLGCDASVAAARTAVLAEAAQTFGRLAPRPASDRERRWQRRLLAHRYRNESWHATGRSREAQWTTRPVLTSTG